MVKNSPMSLSGRTLLAHPLSRRLGWVGFGILFYLSGEAATIWLLEPEQFTGGWQTFWLALFPVLLPAFFLLQRWFGCASGACRQGHCERDERPPNSFPPPG